jgi:outer membrane protein
LLKLKSTLGVNYKSAKLNNYFYGLNSAEFSYGKIEVGSSWQPYAKIDARWPVGKANALRFHLAYYDYSAMDSSPLFEHDYSMTAFIGFEHTF